MRELIASCALKLLQSHCPFWNNLPARSSILYNQQVMVFLLYDLSDFCDTCTQAFTTKLCSGSGFYLSSYGLYTEPSITNRTVTNGICMQFVNCDGSWAWWAAPSFWFTKYVDSCSSLFAPLSFSSLMRPCLTHLKFSSPYLLIVLSFLCFMTYHFLSPSLSSSG